MTLVSFSLQGAPVITVYSKPACMACKMSATVLEKSDVVFDYINTEENDEARDFVEGLGYRTLPVVYVNEEVHWSGFRPERLKELAKKCTEGSGQEGNLPHLQENFTGSPT
jgi:glutaredoxin-like protein NrdH